MLDDGPQTTSSTRRLGLAMGLTGSFMVAEAIGGYLAGSLALLADAGHMLTDTAALALAFFASRLARRPADQHRSYGYERIQVLAALVNALALLALVTWLAFEAIQRLLVPQAVDASLMLWIALLGGGVNVGVAWLLHRGHEHDINLGAAYLHVLSDLGGSIAAALAAVLILTTGWTRADPVLSLIIVALVARVAVRLMRRSVHILLEGTPKGIEPQALASELAAELDEVEEVHHVHAWSLGSREILVTLHARMAEGADHDAALGSIKRLLAERYRITHSTVQIEGPRCADRDN